VILTERAMQNCELHRLLRLWKKDAWF